MNHPFPVAGQILTALLLLALTAFGLNYHITKPLVHLTGVISIGIWGYIIWKSIKQRRTDIVLDTLNSPLGKMGVLISIAMIIVIATTYGSEAIMAKRFSHDFIVPALCFALITPLLVVSNSFKALIAWVIPVAILTMALPGIDEYYAQKQSSLRISGTIDLPIIYGMNLAILCAATIGLTMTLQVKYRPILVVTSLIAVAAGIWAIALSGSRAPLLSIILVTICCIAYQGYRYIGVMKTISVLVILLLSIAFTLPKLPIYKRMTYAIKTIEANNRGSSLGLRFEMWRGAKDIIIEHPLAGSGVGMHNELFAEKIKTNKEYLHPKARSFIHLHNDTINAITWMGVPLGILFMLFFWYPPTYALMHLRKPAGLAIAAASSIYLINGLTNTPSIRATSLTLFLIVISLLIATCHQSEDSESAN